MRRNSVLGQLRVKRLAMKLSNKPDSLLLHYDVAMCIISSN